MPVLIPLTRGLFATVDDADADWVQAYLWVAAPTDAFGGTMRAGRKGRVGTSEPKKVYLHREVLRVGPGLWVDHINGDTLDNRRCNLRPATRRENARNRKRRSDSPFPFKGIEFNARVGRWRARVHADGTTHNAGSYGTAEEAAHAYDALALKLHGAFARLNFPPHPTLPVIAPPILARGAAGVGVRG